jgi:hypothetical protein
MSLNFTKEFLSYIEDNPNLTFVFKISDEDTIKQPAVKTKEEEFLEIVNTKDEVLYSRDCRSMYIKPEDEDRIFNDKTGMDIYSLSTSGGGYCQWYIFRNGSDFYFFWETCGTTRSIHYKKTSLDSIKYFINEKNYFNLV